MNWDLGWFDRDNTPTQFGYSAWRTGANWRSDRQGEPSLALSGERITSRKTLSASDAADGKVERGNAALRVPFGNVAPSANWEGESSTEARRSSLVSGARYQSWGGELATTGIELFGASVGIRTRTDDVYDTLLGRWDLQQRSYTQNWRGAVRSWKGLSGTAEYTWRRRESPSSVGTTLTDVADMDIRQELADGGLRAGFRYRIASTQTAKRERLYVYAGAGRGNYAPRDPDDRRSILSENEVVDVPTNDPSASYVLRYRSTDQFQPTVTLDAAWQLSSDFGRFWKGAADPRSNEQRPTWQRWLRIFGTETSIQVTETDSARTKDLYLAKFWTFRRAGISPTVRGTLRFTQDLVSWKASRTGDLRLRFNDFEDYDGALYDQVGQPAVVHQREFSLRGRLRFGGISEWTCDLKRQQDSRTGSGLDYTAKRYWLDQTYTARPSLTDEWSIRNEVARASDPLPNTGYARTPTAELAAYLLGLEPSWRRSWGSRGMLRASAQWAGVFTSNASPSGLLPVHLLNGRNQGHNFRWSLLASYRLSPLTTMSISYTARRSAGTPLVHTARAEVNAVF
jgi:hypothetical protein